MTQICSAKEENGSPQKKQGTQTKFSCNLDADSCKPSYLNAYFIYLWPLMLCKQHATRGQCCSIYSDGDGARCVNAKYAFNYVILNYLFLTIFTFFTLGPYPIMLYNIIWYNVIYYVWYSMRIHEETFCCFLLSLPICSFWTFKKKEGVKMCSGFFPPSLFLPLTHMQLPPPSHSVSFLPPCLLRYDDSESWMKWPSFKLLLPLW